MKLKMIGLFVAAALAAGCDDPLNVQPEQSIPQGEALNSAEEIRVGTNGMYDALQDCDGGYCRNLMIYPDLYTDNLRFTGTYTTDSEVFSGDVRPANSGVLSIWAAMYDAINRANNVLASIPQVTDFEEGEADLYKGEAHFVRALGYLHLTNYFGGVPLVSIPVTEATPEVNVARSSQAEVWAFIEADLNAAIGLLDDDRQDGRANMAAAQALLARVHLYQREWAEARALADAVIRSGDFALEENYVDVFSTEQTPESILELPFTTTDGNSLAFWFFPRSQGGRRGVAPSNATSDASPITSIFATGDTRRAVAIRGSNTGGYGVKYTDVSSGTDDVIAIRLAEMYLIRSEANARLGTLTTAIEDINRIRARAGVAALAATVDTQDEVLVANLEERRRELFYEGHRFFDLRRFRDIPSVGTYVGTTLGLSEFRMLFPIPQREIDANSALTQNPGY